MPSTSSIVLSTQKSGAISTAPPMATAMKAPTPSSVTLRSSFLCCSVKPIGIFLFGRLRHDRAVGFGIVRRVVHRRFLAQAAAAGEPYICAHKYHAARVVSAATGAKQVHGLQRYDRLGKAVHHV